MTLRSPKIICPMAPDHEIIAAESLYGADGSVYRLYEMNGSYGIYEVENDGERFCEGSFSSNSPYYLMGLLEQHDQSLFYFGPGNYYAGSQLPEAYDGTRQDTGPSEHDGEPVRDVLPGQLRRYGPRDTEIPGGAEIGSEKSGGFSGGDAHGHSFSGQLSRAFPVGIAGEKFAGERVPAVFPLFLFRPNTTLRLPYRLSENLFFLYLFRI